MREIKFRAWDEFLQDMEYDVTYYKEAEGGVRPWVFMQYIGLKDVNKKEIYEGDMVELLPYGIKGIITYEYGMFAVRERGFTHYLNEYNILILGNVYENPELIKKDK